eukprot:4499803-Amphidinium_carterae.1
MSTPYQANQILRTQLPQRYKRKRGPFRETQQNHSPLGKQVQKPPTSVCTGGRCRNELPKRSASVLRSAAALQRLNRGGSLAWASLA